MNNLESDFILSDLFIHKNKIRETQDLIEICFEYPKDQSFKLDFAPLFKESNLSNCKILIDRKTSNVIGHIGVCSRDIKIKNELFPVALLGGICIDPEYRGKKIFNQFFEIVLEKIEPSYALSILWSDASELYIKYGFHLSIEQACYKLVSFHSSTSPYLHTKVLTQQEKSDIKHLYSKHILNKFQTFNRTDSDWEIIFNITSTSLYTEKNNMGKIISYFYTGKGADLKDVIHELAIDDLKSFSSPLDSGELWYPNKIKGHALETHFAAILKVNDQTLFTKLISKLSNNKIRIKELSVQSNTIAFVFNEEDFKTSINEFLCGIWGPGFYSEFDEFFERMYLCGLDSI
jgi:predicted N-acetyltransferase YhbS